MMVEEGPLAVKTGCSSDHITAAYRAELHALVLLSDQRDNGTGWKSFRLCIKKHRCLNWKMSCNTTVPNPPADLFFLYANILVSVVLLQRSFHGQEPAAGWLLSLSSSNSSWSRPTCSVCTHTHTHTHTTTCLSQLRYCSSLIALVRLKTNMPCGLRLDY